MLLFCSFQRAPNDKSEIPATEPPKAQYAELVQLFGGLQDLELKTVDNMFDPEREQALLGPFFKGEPTIPFFEGGNYPDFRFARMVPDTKAVDIGSSRVPHIVAYKTHEAPQLAARTDALLFRAASGSGKTSTIFDAACVRRTIYVVCQIETQPKETQLQESVTGDIVFPQLVNLIFNSIPRAVSLADAQEEARRLITADICVRLSFFLWLHQTFPGITPEQALLVQLNGGQWPYAFQRGMDLRGHAAFNLVGAGVIVVAFALARGVRALLNPNPQRRHHRRRTSRGQEEALNPKKHT